MPANRLSLLSLLAVAGLSAAAHAQGDGQDWVRHCRSWNSDAERICQVRDQTIPAVGHLTVDGNQNGGVSVHGWDRNEILVRAKIQANGEDSTEALEVARQIVVRIREGRIEAEGPAGRRHGDWSVSFELWTPRKTDLDLRAQNGGLAVEDVEGRIDLDTTNGGLTLGRVAGDVRGETTNGGISVVLAGDRWSGTGLDVSTTNGGVSLTMSERYNARLETGTVNGSVHTDFPIVVQGTVGRRIRTDLGAGGAPIRATTTNGSVTLRKASTDQ